MSKKTPASRTNANPDDVFLYCDTLKSRNESITVEKVAAHFSASNTTVGPLVAAWREARSKQPVWPMPGSLNDRAQELVLSIWLLVSEAGQAQLQVEVNTLSSALTAEKAKVTDCLGLWDTCPERYPTRRSLPA